MREARENLDSLSENFSCSLLYNPENRKPKTENPS